MASPQKENGYAPIANELLDALAKAKLNGSEFRVVMHIIRNTYGYSRKEYTASLSKIGEAVDMNRVNVQRTMKQLLSKRITGVIQSDNSQELTYCINKDYDSWCYPIRVQSTVIQSDNTSVVESDNTSRVLPIVVKQKRKNIKKTPSKRTADFVNLFWPLYPKKKDKAAALKKWETLAKNGVLPPTEQVLSAVKDEIKEKTKLTLANKFCPEWKNPSTWLNKGCWDDEHSISSEPKPEIESVALPE